MYFNSLGCFLGWIKNDLSGGLMIWRKTQQNSTNHGSLIPRVLCAVSEHLWLPTEHMSSFAHSSGQRSPLIFWADSYPGLPTPHGSSPVRSALWNLSPRNPVSIVWPPFHYASTPKCLSTQSSDFRGGDLHPCFLTSSPYRSPCLKGGKLQEKTCCTCQNTGLALMDMHETYCSKTLSAVH